MSLPHTKDAAASRCKQPTKPLVDLPPLLYMVMDDGQGSVPVHSDLCNVVVVVKVDVGCGGFSAMMLLVNEDQILPAQQILLLCTWAFLDSVDRHLS